MNIPRLKKKSSAGDDEGVMKENSREERSVVQKQLFKNYWGNVC